MKLTSYMPMDDKVQWTKVQYESIGKPSSKPVIDWLERHGSYTGLYTFGGQCIWFSNDQDAMLFTLKWL